MAMDANEWVWMVMDIYRWLWIAIDGDVYIVSVIKYFICTLHEVPSCVVVFKMADVSESSFVVRTFDFTLVKH